MSVVGVTMVKDEEDVIEHTIRHMLDQVDVVIVADNGSTDGTYSLLCRLDEEYAGRLDVMQDDEPGYYQDAKMTGLAHRAHERYGAHWIVPFDADEWWYSPFEDTIAMALEMLAPQWLVQPATVYNYYPTGLDDHSDTNPFSRMRWRGFDPLPLDKVACRWRSDLRIAMGNHSADYFGEPTVRPDRTLVVKHFPYRSPEQFIRKVRNGCAALAAAPDLPETYCAHWRDYGRILDEHGPDVLIERVYYPHIVRPANLLIYDEATETRPVSR